MSTIGFGTLSSRSRSPIPNPPQNRTTFISGPPLDGRPYPKAVKQEVCARRRAHHPFSRCGDATLRRRDARPSHAFLRQRDESVTQPRPLLDALQVARRDHPAERRVELVRIHESEEATIANGHDAGHPQHPESSPQHPFRSEEHTSELQSRLHLVCRLLLEKKKQRHLAFIY